MIKLELSASDADRTRQGAEDRDQTCRLTGHGDGCEVARLVPTNRLCRRWFDENNMAQYTPDGIGTIHNMSNC
jgi:hypothetical protein